LPRGKKRERRDVLASYRAQPILLILAKRGIGKSKKGGIGREGVKKRVSAKSQRKQQRNSDKISKLSRDHFPLKMRARKQDHEGEEENQRY